MRVIKTFWSMSKTKEKKTCWQCLIFLFFLLLFLNIYKYYLMQLRKKNNCTRIFSSRLVIITIIDQSFDWWPAAIAKITSRSFFSALVLDLNVCLFSKKRDTERKLSLFLCSSREINQSTWQVAFPLSLSLSSFFFCIHAK